MAEKQEYPKMLYQMGEGNVLKHIIVKDAEAHKAAGKDWKTTPPKPRGRPAGKPNKEAAEEAAPEPEAEDDGS